MKEIYEYTVRQLDAIYASPALHLLFKVILTIIFTYILFFIARVVLRSLEKFTKEKTKWEYDEQIVASVKKPICRLILLIGANFVFGHLTLVFGEGYGKYIEGIFYILIVGQILLSLMRLVGLAANIYYQKYFDNRITGGKEEFFPLLIRIIKIILFLIALIIVLKHFNQDVQSLVVSLGVGSLAIALAAQETLSNMIAGFVIMSDRPFRVGDRIELPDGRKGDVHEIGLRSTKLITFDNTLIIVPNAQIVKENITNLTYPDPVTRIKIVVGVAYGTDINKIKTILEDICRGQDDVLAEPPPTAYFLGFGDSTLNVQVTCFVPDWRQEWPVSERIRLEIDRRFREESIEIPFPQRTLWFANRPPDTSSEKGA